jgi:DnaK suppressor protein
MARSDALIRLQRTLNDRREELLRRLGGDLQDLRQGSGESSGDSADQAFESSGEEVTSQLAQLESRELRQIERSLKRIQQGTYGLCEICQKKIPMARLDALPFSTTCIQCQREMEASGSMGYMSGAMDWERASDMEARMREPREINFAQLEADYAK